MEGRGLRLRGMASVEELRGLEVRGGSGDVDSSSRGAELWSWRAAASGAGRRHVARLRNPRVLQLPGRGGRGDRRPARLRSAATARGGVQRERSEVMGPRRAAAACGAQSTGAAARGPAAPGSPAASVWRVARAPPVWAAERRERRGSETHCGVPTEAHVEK